MPTCQRCGAGPAPENEDPYDGDACDCIPPERLEEYDTALSPRAASRLVREARRLHRDLHESPRQKPIVGQVIRFPGDPEEWIVADVDRGFFTLDRRRRISLTLPLAAFASSIVVRDPLD